VARLTPDRQKGQPRPNLLPGKALQPDSFFDPLPEEALKLWEQTLNRVLISNESIFDRYGVRRLW
jgi:hypothetical protein